MSAVSWVATIVYYVMVVFTFLMWGRLIGDFARAFRPDWRPRGLVLVLLNIVYSVTDPPVLFVRRFVRPMRMGAVALDFSWTIVLLAAIVIMYGALAFR